MSPLGIYVHVPFCVRKCSYCDFNAYSGLGGLSKEYVQAVISEIERSPERGRAVSTIFFGGGTPTFLSEGQLGDILNSVRHNFTVQGDSEINAEANPTTADASKFVSMRQAGFNRLSIGVQSFDDHLLNLVDREHSGDQAIEAVVRARSAGFKNVSIDLMFGLPTQTLEDWDRTLTRAIQLHTEHISTYALTIEPGTRFDRLQKGGKLDLPDEETELEMYELAISRLSSASFEHYEVSNFAKPGYQARHNLLYWQNQEYLGFGPGAVSYIGGNRWTNEKHPQTYIERVKHGSDLAIETESLDLQGRITETLIQGLRLRNGISLTYLTMRFGLDVNQMFRGKIPRLRENGLIEQDGETIRLSHQGLLLANDVFVDLLA